MKASLVVHYVLELRLTSFNDQAGIMDEMLDDTMEGLDAEEDLEDEAQEEVDKVLFDITDGKLGQGAGAVGTLPAVSRFHSISRLLHSSQSWQTRSLLRRSKKMRRWKGQLRDC